MTRQRVLAVALGIGFGVFPGRVFAHLAPADRLAEALSENPRDSLSDPSIDWSQPPIGCVEEMVASEPDRPCLDLSMVVNPLSDWPSNLDQADYHYWYSHRRFLSVCRTDEVLRREASQPGSQGAVPLEVSWMTQASLPYHDEAVSAIYEANLVYGIPLHVLTGAIYQESLFAPLGIASDGGNYSCGVGQNSIIGWCRWANAQSASDKQAMDWPAQAIDCSDQNIVNLSFVEPIFNQAETHLGGLPDYRLSKEQFEQVSYEDAVAGFPPASDQIQQLRYRLIRSFYENCSDTRMGILAAAQEIAAIYHSDISEAFQEKDRYAGGQSFQRACQGADAGNAYPLHTGWLMAVGIYNAGPRVPEVISYYNGWSWGGYHDAATIQGFTPDQIVDSLYWGGRYDPATDLIDFTSFSGSPDSWLWYKACVVQRHVARVMQNVTLLPDFFVQDLEGQYPCAKSIFNDGQLVQSSVPPFRQTSSGVKDSL